MNPYERFLNNLQLLT